MGSQGKKRQNILYSGEGNGLWSQGHVCTKSHKGGTLPGMIHSYKTDYIVGHMCHWLTHSSPDILCLPPLAHSDIYKGTLLFKPLCGPNDLQFPSTAFQSFSSLQLFLQNRFDVLQNIQASECIWLFLLDIFLLLLLVSFSFALCICVMCMSVHACLPVWGHTCMGVGMQGQPEIL